MINYTELYDLLKLKTTQFDIDSFSISSINDYIEINKKYYKNFNILNYFKQAKTILSFAISYKYLWNNYNNNGIGYIARYTTANFYKDLGDKLDKIGKYIKNIYNPQIKNSDYYRVFVNSKINDKLCAFISNLGKFSINSTIFVKDKGTMFLLGEILLSEQLNNYENKFIEYQENIVEQKCLYCKLCEQLCPTKAIQNNTLIKEKCLQYLTTFEDLNYFLNEYFIKNWGVRFYGCSICIDVCPYNQKLNYKNNNQKNFIGYIGLYFDTDNLLKFKKEDYKFYFKNNQLSLSWVKPYILSRNCLFSLYNQNKKEIIKEYLKNIDFYNWDDFEKDYLKKICNFLLNL